MEYRSVTRGHDEIEQLKERVAYLKREAEMMTRVIEFVPYDENPPQKPSILELLAYIDRIQTDYFLPLVQQAAQNEEELAEYPSLKTFYDNLDINALEDENIQVLLKQIVSHRQQVINQLDQLDDDAFATSFEWGEAKTTLIEAINDITNFETSILSEISDQVMVYSQQRSNQREIDQRRQQQENDK